MGPYTAGFISEELAPPPAAAAAAAAIVGSELSTSTAGGIGQPGQSMAAVVGVGLRFAGLPGQGDSDSAVGMHNRLL